VPTYGGTAVKYLLMIYLRCVETIHGEGAVHLHYETR
jgi:hypothetical protein